MKAEKRPAIPMNLQLFAEQPGEQAAQQQKPEPQKSEDPEQSPESGNPEEPEQNPEEGKPNTTPTLEEVMAEAATERAAKERNKAALDKALKEVRELKESLRKKMSAQEQEDEAKREQEEQHQAYVASLEEFKHRTEAEKRYLMQGMNPEMAEKAAKAEVEGNMDSLAAIQRQHTEKLLREKEAEWKKSSAPINAGIDGDFSVTKEQFDKMGYQKRAELKANHPEIYKQLKQLSE